MYLYYILHTIFIYTEDMSTTHQGYYDIFWILYHLVGSKTDETNMSIYHSRCNQGQTFHLIQFCYSECSIFQYMHRISRVYKDFSYTAFFDNQTRVSSPSGRVFLHLLQTIESSSKAAPEHSLHLLALMFINNWGRIWEVIELRIGQWIRMVTIVT